jgi:hypothetical protein
VGFEQCDAEGFKIILDIYFTSVSSSKKKGYEINVKENSGKSLLPSTPSHTKLSMRTLSDPVVTCVILDQYYSHTHKYV